MAHGPAGHLLVIHPVVAAAAQTTTAQIATLTLTAVPGVVGTPAQTVTAQPATLTLTAVAGSRTVGAVTKAAQPASLTLTAVAGALSSVTVLLSDDFPGAAIDSSKWDVYNRCGDLVNNEVNAVIPANVRVSSGTLKIDSKFEDVFIGDSETPPTTYHYTSGQIAERNVSFRYGSVQVRAKICANGTGTWPCIWMLGQLWQASQPYTANVPGHDWPNGGWWEIDIAEFMQGHRTLQNCALHFVTANRGGSGEKSIPFAADSRFMVYRLDWTATSLTWYVDAEDGVGWRTLLTITGTAGTDIPNTPGYLIIHTAIGGAAAETPVSGTFPVFTEVDYARVTLDATSSVTVLAQPATLTLTAVPGSTAGATTRAAQAASLALTAVPGAVVPGAVTVVAQPATLTLSGVPGVATGGAVTRTAQVAALALTAVPGTSAPGPATTAAQPAALMFTAVPGVTTSGQTVVAQVATLTLSPVAGVSTTGPVTTSAQPATVTLTAHPGVTTTAGVIVAQIATLTLTAVSGTTTTGAVSMAAQPATLTLTGVPGSSVPGGVTTLAQPATLTLTAVAGAPIVGAVTMVAQPATMTLTAVPFIVGQAAALHVGALEVVDVRLGDQQVLAVMLGADQIWP